MFHTSFDTLVFRGFAISVRFGTLRASYYAYIDGGHMSIIPMGRGFLPLQEGWAGERQERAVVCGRSPAFRAILRQVELVARRDTTVLLSGETGSGKEVVARALHRGSGRSGSLITVNCAGVPAQLLESEFFGSEKGAYTDAGRARAGLLEKADGGTLLLDEIGEMPAELQPKLLRALQEGEVTRLGGGTPRKVDVRVIAATNRDLWKQVQSKEFREDLFYRISVFPIRLPALRERPEDISEFVHHFVAMFCRRDETPVKGVEARAMESLRTRRWPGNVRELRNAVELAVIHAQERRLLALEDFPIPRKQPEATRCSESRELHSQTTSAAGLSEMVAHFERDLIERALEQAKGNKSLAATRLHVKRTTLVEKIKRFEREGLLATA